MKYDKDLYIESGIYGLDEDVRNLQEKLVKCRKMHKCASCERDIKVGEQALYETGFTDDGIVSVYTCLECVEEWLEESEQVDDDD